MHGLALVDFKRPNAPVGFRVDVTTGQHSANDSLKAHVTAAVGAPTDIKTNLFGGNVDLTVPTSSESNSVEEKYSSASSSKPANTSAQNSR